MVASLHASGAVAVVVVLAAVLLAYRRSPGTAFAVVVAALCASNSGFLWLKQPFLTARWAATIALAVLLLPELRRADAAARRALALLAILPALCLASALWSVDPRLTVERAFSFALVLWIVAALALAWRREPAELSSFVDALAVLAAVVLGFSLLAWAVTGSAQLNHVVRGIFENPNGLGLMLGLTFPFVAAALERRRHALLQLAYLAVCIVVATEARARGGLVVLAIAGVGFALSRRRPRHAVAAVAIGVAAIAGVTQLSGGNLTSPAPPAATVQPSQPSSLIGLGRTSRRSWSSPFRRRA